MLTHGNLAYQINNFRHFITVAPGQRTLSLLPPWHIYERSCGYYIYSRGAHQASGVSVTGLEQSLSHYLFVAMDAANNLSFLAVVGFVFNLACVGAGRV